VKNWLLISSAMDTRSASRPAKKTRLVPNRRARLPPSSEAVTAVTTCGRNMVPYWVLDRPYSLGLVKMVLAAGNVTSAIPCTSPAAYTVLTSGLVAMGSPQSVIVRFRKRGLEVILQRGRHVRGGRDDPAEPGHRHDCQQHLGDLVLGRTRRQRPAGAPFHADRR